MSKRSSHNFGGDEERYGGSAVDTMGDEEKPQKATAAQLARRKIAAMKKPGGRARSGSPAVIPQADGSAGGGGGGGGGMFGQPQQPQQQQSQNAFQASSFNFSFGGGGGAQQENGGSAPFQFGVSAPAPSQQNGGTTIFGQSQPAAPSFGSFNGGSTQPSTNGFNPSTSSIFTQQPQQTNSAPSFGGFGATQTNGTTPSTIPPSTFGSFGAAGGNASLPNGSSGSAWTGFNKPPEENSQQEVQKSNNFFGGFGATQPEKEKAATSFAGFGAAQPEKDKPSNIFGNLNATQPEKDVSRGSTPFPGFGAAQSEKDPSRASTPFSGFGATQQEKQGNAFGVFGAKANEGSEKSTSVLGQAQTNGDKATNVFASFGQKQTEASEKAGTPFSSLGQTKSDASDQPNSLFGGFSQTNGDKSASTQPKANTVAPSNSFAGFGAQTNGGSNMSQEPKNDLFKPVQSQAASKPEQPATSIFSQSAQPSGEKKGLFGSSLAPATTLAGTGSVFDNLPKKDLSNGGKPLFSSADPSQIYRPEEDPEENANEDAANGSTNIFGQSSQKPSLFATPQTQAASKPTSNLFNLGNQTPATSASQQDTSMTSMSTPSTNTSNNLFGSAVQASSSTQGPARSLFDRIDKDDVAKRLGKDTSTSSTVETPRANMFGAAQETPSTAKPSMFGGSSLFQKPGETAQGQAPKDSPSKSLFQKPASQSSTTAPLTPAPPATAPTFLNAPPATAPAARTAPPPSRPPAAATSTSADNLTAGQKAKMKQLNDGLVGHLNAEDPEKDWTSIFQYYMKMASQISGSPLPADATAPIAQPAAAPQIPATNNLFSRASSSAIADTANAQTPKPPTASGIFSKPPSTAPPATKKRPLEQDEDSAQPPATEKRAKPNEQVNYPKLPENASSTSKLFEAALDKSKVSESSNSASTSLFKPSTAPMFSASTSQTSASKPVGGFKPNLTTPAAGATNFLASFGQAAKANEEKERKKRKMDDYDSDDETEEAWEKRDREEQEAKRAKFAEAAKSAKGFSFTSTNEPPKTPAFKFGSGNAASTTPAVPPPQLNNLFGSLSKPATSSTTSETGKLAPPTGFGFGPASSSVEASRATTPGLTTDGEASTAANDDGEPSDDVPDMTQGEDPNALQSSELSANEVLLDIPNALTRKFAKKEGEEKSTFQTQGEGRVYLLKDKTSGKTRILSRVGLGKIILNFNPMKGMTYTVHAKKTNLVICDFLDHINYSPPKPDRFYITTGSADEAKELSRLLLEGVPQ